MKINESIDSVLQYWFGSASTAAAINGDKSALWWSKNEKIDREIELRFGDLVEAAARSDELQDWAFSSRGALALVILNDQFPRNIWRGTANAFSVDERARERANIALAGGMDSDLRPIERVFLYLPFEHSEAMEDQLHSLDLFRRLAEGVPAEERALFDGFTDFARKHHDIIARFGRFPHRNAILGRESTADEVAFLQLPGSSF